jgi:hypothetical protein
MKRGGLLLLVVAIALAFALGACAEVLGIRPPSKRPFPHHRHTAQGGVSCVQCHEGITSATESDPLHLPTTATCVGCHKKPHDPRECSGCHGLETTRAEAQMDRENLRFKHSTHYLRLKGDCAYCHEGVRRDSGHVRPPMAVCLSCHEHQQEFAEANSCDRCHRNLRGDEVKPESHVAHDGDWLREHGGRALASGSLCETCHAEKFCGGCHGKTVPALPEKMAFDDPLRAGVHRAGFVSRHSLEARTQPGLCTTCHTTQDFCEGCHAQNKVDVASGGPSPHPVGWLGLPGEQNDHGPAAWRDPSVCAGCHSGAGEQLCVGCHRVGGIGGNPHRPGWSTNRKTTDPACRACHS